MQLKRLNIELYEAYFDPYDYLAYISGIFIVYLFDKLLDRYKMVGMKNQVIIPSA